MAGSVDVLAVVVEHETELLRTAYLLTGDQRAAEELVTDALARAHRRRRRRRAGGDPEAVVLQDLVRRWLRHSSSHRPVAAPRPAGPLPDGRTELLRQALLGLPPRTRAALVLRVHDRLAEADSAAVLGCAPAAVTALVEEGSSALYALLPPDPPPTAPPSVDAPATGDPAPGDPDAIYRRPG